MIRLKNDVSRRVGNSMNIIAQHPFLMRHYLTKLDFSSNGNSRCESASEGAVRSRLSNATTILQEEKSFQSTSARFYDLYSKEKLKIFDDLRVTSHRKRAIVMKLCRGFAQSRSMRAFYMDQLFRCIASQNYWGFITGVKMLEKTGSLSIYERLLVMEIESAINIELIKNDAEEKAKSLNDGISSECLDLLMLIAITSGEPLIGASFALHSKDLLVAVKTETLERIISALSINDPLLSNYHSFAILKLINCYDRDYSLRVVLKAIQNMTINQNPFFANLLHDKFAKRFENNPVIREALNSTRKSLITSNTAHGNYHRAAALWKLNFISSPEFCAKNTSLFQSLVEKISDDDLVEDLILNHFPKSLYTDPDFVDFSIACFGQREKFRSKFEYVTKSLKPPLKRNTISSLFNSFIAQDREKAAEKILQVIFKTKNGLNSEDFLVIIKKLLAKNQLLQCVEMCNLNDFRVSCKGSMKVLEFLMAHSAFPEDKRLARDSTESYDAYKNSFMKKLVKNLYKKSNEREIYHIFTATLLEYFSTHVNNRVSRKLYSDLSYSINKADSEPVNLSSYNVPPEFGLFLLIEGENRLQCLEIILNRAHMENDLTLIHWCALELQAAGIPVVDIEKYYLDGTGEKKG